MNKFLFSFLFASSVFFLFPENVFAQKFKAIDVVNESAKKDNISESINYVQSCVNESASESDRRSILIFLASLYEQISDFEKARENFVKAAAISAGDAENMQKKTNEQLVLDAVRCALSSGDSETADRYLNSAVRNSKDEKIQAYIKLYSQWSSLCRAENQDEIQEPVEILRAYTKINSMKSVYPAIYLTLWYITGEDEYSDALKNQFGESVEAAIVKGDANLLPTPFWFFVPKSGQAEPESGTLNVQISDSRQENEKIMNSESEKTKIWQLGLFRSKNNAELLVQELKQKGFECYIESEKRASGTTYFLVLTKENESNSKADALRSAGYEITPFK